MKKALEITQENTREAREKMKEKKFLSKWREKAEKGKIITTKRFSRDVQCKHSRIIFLQVT